MQASSAVLLTPSQATFENTTTKRIRLHFKCRGLADLDTFSKSDPYVVVYNASNIVGGIGGAGATSNANFRTPQQSQQQFGYGAPVGGAGGRMGGVNQFGVEIGRTETIMNDLNPVFKRPIAMNFFFETKQPLNVVVYDYDGTPNDAANDICGIASFQLSHVICSAQGKKEFPLRTPSGASKGFVEVSFSEVSAVSSRNTVKFGFRGANLVSVGTFGGSPSPFFTISRLQPNGTKMLIYQSEVASAPKTPKWAITRAIRQSDLIGASNDDQSIVFDLLTKGTFTGVTGMGSYKCSLNELKALTTTRKGECFNTRKAKNVSKSYADIFVDVMDIMEFPTFVQSLANGWQINMVLSIDFTGSNGDPRQPHSLHFMNPNMPNQYVSAIMSVGDILLEYDSDKQIPVYGFGASFQGATNHFFNVSMKEDPYVSGIQGAINAYGAFLPTCILSGPTNFAPTIRGVTDGARRYEAERVYTILLIITDGAITDMRQTVDALVEADDAPLSIVIVGVGNADFTSMEELDGDGVNLRASNGRISRRDLVQFVPYRDFLPPKPREALAAEVLREVPDQFEEYLMLASQRQGAAGRMNAAMPKDISEDF